MVGSANVDENHLNQLLPQVSGEIENYLRELGVDDERLYRWLPEGEVVVRELHGNALGKYNPLRPGRLYIDPKSLANEETAREVIAHEQFHTAQHLSGSMERYVEELGSEAGAAFIEGAASAATEGVIGYSRPHPYPLEKELYRMLEARVGKYEAFLGTDHALSVAKDLWREYGKAIIQKEPLEEAA
ncbi:MAG: hypothetical protein HYW25_00750 [Candidatus Aenigmarchaeota archaeon]|nr:hypothetical protein [Candidatus Aenigmarchaeota archaeon]